jgi:D-alanine-D-alanine ligase
MADIFDNSGTDTPEFADFGRVVVLMGGTSAERDISLETGNAVLAALLRKGIDAVAVDTAGDIFPQLAGQNFTCAFVALHGRGGEDGVIQGMLETMQIPYSGSGVLGSALAMDKIRSKWIWLNRGVPTPPCIILESEADLERAAAEIGFPVMVKPVHEGSSCGITRVAGSKDLNSAWMEAKKYDNEVMAERWIDGIEYTVSILNDEILPLIRLETSREFYDYHAKYLDDTTRYICPCGLAKDREAEIGQQALTAFRLVNASGWGRVDLILDASGTAWFIEVNTVPGLTSHSLVPMAARQAGISFDDLVIRILAGCNRPAGSRL